MRGVLKYAQIGKVPYRDREKDAYKKDCVLKFLTEVAKSINSDKHEINFENSKGGVKRILCEKACKIISTCDVSKYDKEFPDVKKFLKKL